MQIRFPLKCHCNEIYHFINAHTLALLISWVCRYTNTINLYRYIFYAEGSLYRGVHLSMPTCFILLHFTHICIFQHWRNKDNYYHYHLRLTHCGRLTWLTHLSGIYLGIRCDNDMSSDRRRVIFFKINCIFWCQNLCRFMVGMLSVCYRFEFEIVGLLSVTSPALCWWSVFNRCHVGYLSVSNRAIPYRILPDMNPTGFTVSSATLSVADSWPIQWKICVFCRFRVGLAGVTGVWQRNCNSNHVYRNQGISFKDSFGLRSYFKVTLSRRPWFRK